MRAGRDRAERTNHDGNDRESTGPACRFIQSSHRNVSINVNVAAFDGLNGFDVTGRARFVDGDPTVAATKAGIIADVDKSRGIDRQPLG